MASKKSKGWTEIERFIKAETKKFRRLDRQQYKKALAEYRAAYKIFAGK